MINFGDFLKFNLSIVPIKEGEKRPALPWTKYQTEKASGEEALSWSRKFDRIGIVGGAVSGGLEILDFDNHQHDAEQRFKMFSDTIDAAVAGLLQKFVIETTKNGGYHVYYRYPAENYAGNLKLAGIIKENGKPDYFIETRGQYGQVVACPTEGYKLIQGKFSNIPTITRKERDLIIEICKAFDEGARKSLDEELDEADRNEGKVKVKALYTGDSRFQEANDNIDCEQLLRNMEWQYCGTRGEVSYWKRPGKEGKGISATFNYKGSQRFYVFTSNSEFEPLLAYSKIDVLFAKEMKRIPKKTEGKLALQVAENAGYLARRTQKVEPITRKVLPKPQPIEMDAIKKAGTQQKENAMQRTDTTTASADDDKIKQLPTENETEHVIAGDHPTTEVLKAFEKPELRFWTVKVNKGDALAGTPVIDKACMYRFAEECGGFGMYQRGENNCDVVRLRDNRLETVPSTSVKRFVKDFIDTMPDVINTEPTVTRAQLQQQFADRVTKMFDKGSLDLLRLLDIDNKILKNDRDNKYLPFLNGAIHIHLKDKKAKPEDRKYIAEFVSYESIDKWVWRDRIIQRQFYFLPKDELFAGEFRNFLKNVCTTAKDCNYSIPRSEWIYSKERFHALMSMIGYLLDSYKAQSEIRIAVLCEERIGASEDSTNGQTGKTLIGKFINFYTPTLYLSGKRLNFSDPFLFQRYEPHHTVIRIDDTEKKLPFEQFFDMTCNGIVVNRKNQPEYSVPYEQSPKILLTTNYVITGDTSSVTRRKFDMELSPYYGDTHSPKDEIGGREFFDEHWDETIGKVEVERKDYPDLMTKNGTAMKQNSVPNSVANVTEAVAVTEWRRADNFAVQCLLLFTQQGLTEYERVNLDQRRLNQSVPEEFQDMAKNMKIRLINMGRLTMDELYNEFRDNLLPMNKTLYEKYQRQTVKAKFDICLKMQGVSATYKQFGDGNYRGLRGWQLDPTHK